MGSFLGAELADDFAARRVAVVIPCHGVRDHILHVLAAVPAEVSAIYCVDDACPDACGDLIEEYCGDDRVRVLRHDRNRGVGGATVTGYRAALRDGADIVVKLDGDGQMNPAQIPIMIQPIVCGEADYTKGNRFFHPEDVYAMPRVRLLGNVILSFLSKLSTGYWQIFDPTNGYTAIHAEILRRLPLDKLHRRYFFESDILFRLNTIRAVILDIPVPAIYGSETSGVRVLRAIPLFAFRHTANFFKRLFYNYFLRDFHVASVEWLVGPLLLLFGVAFGSYKWIDAIEAGVVATAGTVMLAALPIVMGLQLTLSALSFDIQSVPRTPIHRLLLRRKPDRDDDSAQIGLVHAPSDPPGEEARQWDPKRKTG